MGLFSFFNKKAIEEINNVPSKELFIEENEMNEADHLTPSSIINLESIYMYAATDFEDKGYDDAIGNPDLSYRKDNLKLLRYDLKIMIKRSFRTYDDYMKDLNFHIESRKEAGLIDTVKLLESQHSKILEAINELRDIEKDFSEDTGLVERISLSYSRGFSRGLAAMSDEILDRNV